MIASRGLCPRCYQTALRMIARGETTWEQLEEIGMSRPAREPLPSVFAEKFAKATNGE